MKKSSAKLLQSGIVTCLGGPGGEPDECHVEAAAYMAKVLLEEGFEVDDDTMKSIRGDNAYRHDFIKDVEKELKQAGGIRHR